MILQMQQKTQFWKIGLYTFKKLNPNFPPSTMHPQLNPFPHYASS